MTYHLIIPFEAVQRLQEMRGCEITFDSSRAKVEDLDEGWFAVTLKPATIDQIYFIRQLQQKYTSHLKHLRKSKPQ